jgi:putative MATE family efflux protein|nr:MAG: MATE family efflux transporter [bacterium]
MGDAMGVQVDGAPGPVQEARGRWWRTVSDAVWGRGSDPTRGPVGRAVLLLAIPMVLEMLMESVFAVVDIFFVSMLGAEAVAAVGLTETLLSLVYTVAAGVGIGVTALVARRIGEQDEDAAARATVQAVALGAALAAVLGVAGIVYARPLLRLMGASADVVAVGAGYTAVSLGSSGVVLLLFLLNAAFRGAGDAAVAMRVLWLANGLNIALDPLLIFGLGPFPAMGVTGAAVATAVSRATGVAFQLGVLLRADGRLRIRGRHVRIQPAIMWRLVRLSGTGTLQGLIGTVSWIGLARIIAEFGSEALAGYTIAIRVILFALLPAWGFGNAAATMVGQGLGAGDPDRAERAVWLAGLMNLVLLGSAATVSLIAAPGIIALFGTDGATSAYAIRCLRIVSLGFYPYAFGAVLTQAFNGAGDVWTATLLNLASIWVFEFPLAWMLAFPLGLGADGVFIALACSFSALSVLSALVFRRGRWRRVVV